MKLFYQHWIPQVHRISTPLLSQILQVSKLDKRTQSIFEDAFAVLGRLDNISLVMGFHPQYLESFLRTQHYLLLMDGPLSLHCRHYIGIMVRLQTVFFVWNSKTPVVDCSKLLSVFNRLLLGTSARIWSTCTSVTSCRSEVIRSGWMVWKKPHGSCRLSGSSIRSWPTAPGCSPKNTLRYDFSLTVTRRYSPTVVMQL